jgi:hypothetical protein
MSEKEDHELASYRTAWRRYRKSAWTLRAGLLVYGPGSWLLERIGPRWLAVFLFPGLLGIGIIAAYFTMFMFRCPRCGNPFFADRGQGNFFILFGVLFRNRCRTCRLQAGESPVEAADSDRSGASNSS